MSKDRQESSWGDNPNLLERIQVRQMMIAGDDKIGLPLNGTFKVLGITGIGLQWGKLDRSGNNNGHGSELVDEFGKGLFRAVQTISNLWISEDAEEFGADGIGEKQETFSRRTSRIIKSGFEPGFKRALSNWFASRTIRTMA